MNDKPRLCETDIRPDYLIREQQKRYQADVARLLEFRDKFMVVACPACASDHYQFRFEKDELAYVVCEQCGMMFVNPRPTPEILEFFYANSENYAYWNSHIFPASEEARRERIFRPRVEKLLELCRRYAMSTGTVMDVGAGFGTFCEEIERLSVFSHVIAVEPTPDLAETCRRKGLDVIALPFEQVQLSSGSIDVITGFEVLEHLFAPRNFMQQCWNLLAPGGMLVLTCPNGQGFDVQTLGTLSNTVDVEHLNYFHPDAVSQLAKACGFEVLEVSTPGKLDAELVRKKALDGQFDLTGQPFLHQVLIEDWDRVGSSFQAFLADNLLSSHMWLVARKQTSSTGRS